MTTAPPNLLAVRALVREHTGLSAVETGIVGDDAHDGGYHCGRSGVDPDDYSVDESPRDSKGLTDWASANDIGYWSRTVNGKRHDLRSMSIWLVAQCKANTPDSRDLREIIYSPDGKVVKRWDRLGKRSTGDSSHLSHTHISFFRDATKANRDQTPLFRRYFASIGLLKLENEMELTDQVTLVKASDVKYSGTTTSVEGILASTNYYVLQVRNQNGVQFSALDGKLTALTGVVEALAETIRAGGGSVDTAAILAGVDQRLAALEASTRDAVADLGEGGAAQVRADG